MTGRGWLLLLVLLISFAGGWLAWKRFEGSAPLVAGPNESLVVGAAGGDVELTLRDEASGLRDVRAVLTHARGEAVLLEESYPGTPWAGGASGERRVTLSIDPQALDAPDGEAFLKVTVRDWSLRSNEALFELPVSIDRKPPRLGVESGLTYVTAGSSAAGFTITMASSFRPPSHHE